MNPWVFLETSQDPNADYDQELSKALQLVKIFPQTVLGPDGLPLSKTLFI
jgi:hypothetical protein